MPLTLASFAEPAEAPEYPSQTLPKNYGQRRAAASVESYDTRTIPRNWGPKEVVYSGETVRVQVPTYDPRNRDQIDQTTVVRQQQQISQSSAYDEVDEGFVGDSAAAARTVVLQKGKQGFGFVLRGARCQRQHEASLDFNPTPQFPALQYLDRVDRGSMADKAGLKPGDFVLEINGENVVNATHDHTVRVIKSSGDTLAMKVITVKPLSQDGMDVHMDGTRTLPVKKKGPKTPVRNPHTSLSTRMNNSNAHTMIESIAELEKLDHALAEYETNADSHSMGYSADAAAKGIDPNNKTASIRRQTKRLTSVPLDAIFTREEEVEVDPRRSASNQARPVVTGVPGRSYGAQGLGRSHAVSTPNLSKEQQHMYIASQEDYSHHIARVELRDSDQGRAGAYPLHHSEHYSPGGHTVTNVRISTVASHDQVSYHKDPQERIYAVPYKGLPRHGSTEYMVDQDQSSADSGLSVQIGPNAGRALPPEPRAPPPPPPQDSRVMIPPPPTHPAPTPPSSEVGEMIPINTRSQHVYANVSADIMRRKAAPAPQEDDGSVESSFRPGAGARLSKQPAVLPKAAVIVKSDHSRSSSMSSNMSSISEHSSGRMASHNIVSSQASIETENNVIVAPAPSDVYYQRRTDNVQRNEPYYEPAPDYEIEGGSASETSSADSVRRSKVLSTPVPSPSQQKTPQDKNAFGDSIKAAALAREKRAREDEVRKQEEARQRQAAEEAKQRQAEEEAKRRKADEEKRRQLEVEAKQRQAAEEAKRKQIAEETKQRQAAEEAQRRKAAEETKQRQVAAAALAGKQRQASEDARRRELEEEAKRKRAEEELKQKQAAARQRYAAEEAKQKQAEEDLRKRQEDEAARRLVAAAEAKRKQEEQLKREEEGRRRQQEAQEKREAEERAMQQKKIEAENERVRLLQAARVTTARQQVSAPPPPPPAPTSVPPPPPVAPPPPPPLEKRETTPPAPRQVPPHIQKELEDKKKRDQSHAALLAAVAKRRNLVDQRDNNQGPDSIEDRLNRSRQLQGAKTAAVIAEKQAPAQPMSQKQTPSNVKAEQTTKVFTATAVKQEKRTAPPPPVSSPPAATAAKASAVENKPEGGSPEELDFLAMAERKRMEWLQKKATSPTNTLERKPAKPKEQEAETDKKESPTKPPPPPEIKQYEPKPKPPPTQRSQSPERSAGLGNLASVIALRAQERQQIVDSKSDGKNNNNEPKKGGTVIYRSGQPSGNKANVGAPTTRPKPNVQKTTDWSEKTVEIKGATVDYSSTETPGASRTSSFLNRSAGKDSVNGQVQNGESSHLSVTAKAKLFGSSVSKGSSRGVSSPHKDSRTPLGGQNNGNSFSPDDVPPPMIPPPQDFDSSSHTGQQHQSRSNGHSGSSWNSRSGPSRAPRGPGSPSKLAQLSPTRQGHSSVHSNDNGVTHMVLIPDDTSTSTDVDLPIVPPPPVFDSDFVQSGLPQVDDTASMASTVSTLSTLSSVADQDTLLHSSGLGIAPPPPPSDSSFKIEIAPPPPGFDDSPSDFIPPPMGFELDSASSKRNSSTSSVTGGGPSHSMMFPAVNKTQKAFLSKPIETWSIGDVGDWLDSIQLGEHRDRFSRQNISGQKLVQMGRSELIALGVTQVGHRMSVERAIKKAMMRK